jgi:predicted nucleic acid-binding protein
VVNASPVIALAAVGLDHLLTAFSPKLLLPEAVASEILAGPTSDPARKLVEQGWPGWAQKIAATAVPATVVEWGLGRGESEVLAVALETSGSTAVLDDAAARTAAKSLGIPLIGTLGVVLRAKKHQHLRSAAAAIAQLKSAGLYLDDNLIQAVLQQIGETWPPLSASATHA